MPSLQVRDLPDHLYQKIVQRAAEERRSIAQETVILLERALEIDIEAKARRRAKIEKILTRPSLIDGQQAAASPVDLIREDRKR